MRKLTARLRKELKKPLGEVISKGELLGRLEGRKMVIAVGDICVLALLEKKSVPDVCVFDLRCMRARLGEEDAKTISESVGKNAVSVKNPAGTITEELENEVRRVVEKGNGNIFVDGEEDLAALVAIAYSPDGAVVIYGQPNEGIVFVPITEEKRILANEVLEEMKV